MRHMHIALLIGLILKWNVILTVLVDAGGGNFKLPKWEVICVVMINEANPLLGVLLDGNFKVGFINGHSNQLL